MKVTSKKLKDLIFIIKSDLFRYYGDVSLRRFFLEFFTNNAFIYSFWLRVSASKIPLISFIGFIILQAKKTKLSIHISHKVKCGYGLYLGHGTSIIINPTTVIGNNCSISHFVSIGSSNGPAAVIGDNVFIGPNVSIIGNVKIGNDVIIGAGIIVTRDIESYSISVGNPNQTIGTTFPKNKYLVYKASKII